MSHTQVDEALPHSGQDVDYETGQLKGMGIDTEDTSEYLDISLDLIKSRNDNPNYYEILRVNRKVSGKYDPRPL